MKPSAPIKLAKMHVRRRRGVQLLRHQHDLLLRFIREFFTSPECGFQRS
jgi:hypothetical protein